MLFEKIIIDVIKHYYWFLVAIAASLMFGFRDTSSILIVISVLATFICLGNYRFRFFDVCVVAYVIYCLFIGLFNSYSFRLFYLGIRSELIPICFYFFARTEKFKNDDFLLNMRMPLLFAMFCGIAFYFTMPSFYLSYKASVLWNSMNIDASSATGHLLYEISRLSSFWPHSYFIGYAALFVLVLTTKRIIIDNAYKKLDSICMVVSFFCLFFAQQRVSIAFALLYLVLLTLYAKWHRLEKRYILYAMWVGAAVLGVLIATIAVMVLGPDFVEYVMNRSINYDGNMVGDRFALFEHFVNDLSLFGDGLGRYGHGAHAEGFSTIPDCDYIRVPAELGFVGFSMLMLICFVALVRGIQILKYCFFEVVCLSFALVSMLGAATWELGTLHPFLYWFCIGHIQSKFERRNELSEEYSAYIAQERGESGDEKIEVDCAES